MRTYVTLRVNSLDANLSAECAFGFIMMDGDQLAAGGFPDPIADIDASWLYWDRRVVLPASDSGQNLHIDMKSRRKFRGNDDNLVFIIENDDAVQSLEWALGARILLALP